jgi:hypothetical protein
MKLKTIKSEAPRPLGPLQRASGARIKWMFTTEKARAKISRAYPEPLIAPKSHAKES